VKKTVSSYKFQSSNVLQTFYMLNFLFQVLRGTHKCGRVDHGKTGGQQGADIERVELLKKQYELVNVDLQPG
jgi:hypothetical protein